MGALLRAATLALLVAGIAMLPAVARADSSSTYQVSGTLASGGTYSGTLEFDYSNVTGLTTLVNSNFTADGVSFTCNGQFQTNQCVVFDPVGTDYFQVESGSSLVLLEWSQVNWNGAPPATLAFIGGYCDSCGFGTRDPANGGTGQFVTAPEPSALLMLGIGLAGLLAFSWRRLHTGTIA